MTMRQIKVPFRLYKQSVKFKEDYMRRNGKTIPLYKALAEVEGRNKRMNNNGGDFFL